MLETHYMVAVAANNMVQPPVETPPAGLRVKAPSKSNSSFRDTNNDFGYDRNGCLSNRRAFGDDQRAAHLMRIQKAISKVKSHRSPPTAVGEALVARFHLPYSSPMRRASPDPCRSVARQARKEIELEKTQPKKQPKGRLGAWVAQLFSKVRPS
jgi:hypothetical protein